MGHFLPFYPILLVPQIIIWNKCKKPGDVILLHTCIINEDHMMYNAWVIRHNKQSFFTFWTSFSPLILDLKNQSFEKMKKVSEDIIIINILSFSIFFKMMIIWCMVPETTLLIRQIGQQRQKIAIIRHLLNRKP